MSQDDIIERVQSNEEERGTTIGTIAEFANFLGTIVFYLGLFRMFAPGEFAGGVVTLLAGAISMVLGMFGPGLKAALHARDKKYLNCYVFYGSRMILRRIELIDDPLVIAKQTEEGELEFVKQVEDTEYEAAIRALGINFLTDKDIDKKMEAALRQRYTATKEKLNRKSVLRRTFQWPKKETEEETEEEERKDK